nr:PEP-CTERM sorting domain-containing protein [uncultured Desulfobacter sp.]
MKKFLLLVGFLLIIGIAGRASAVTVQNASFEQSDLNGWTISSASYVSAAESIYYTNSGTTYWATDSDYFAQLEGGDAYIYQALSWSAGDTISFDLNFLNLDSPDADYGFFGILDLTAYLAASSTGSITNYTIEYITIGGTSGSGGTSTGWSSYSYTFTFDSTSDYAIIFSVDSSESGGSFYAPTLLVDNITTTTVPEPASLFLLATGLLSIAGIGRKLWHPSAK